MHTIEIRPTRFMSMDYAVTHDGGALTTVYDTQGPLSCRFDGASGAYQVKAANAGGSIVTHVLRSIAQQIAGNAAHVLIGPDGTEIARARGRGVKDHGFDVSCGGVFAGSLVWNEKTRAFAWHMDGSDLGYVQRHPETPRGITAMLPDAVPVAVQVFVGLLALSHWDHWRSGE